MVVEAKTRAGQTLEESNCCFNGSPTVDRDFPVNVKLSGLWKSISKFKAEFLKRGLELQPILNANEFNVADLRLKFDMASDLNPHFNFLWNNWVPKKVNIRNWRASRNRLPTLTQLNKRGVRPRSLKCAWCNVYDETIDHVLTACPFAIEVWELVASWCNVSSFYAFHVSDLHNMHFSLAGDKTWRKMLNAIILIAIWNIWKARNDVIHNRVFVSSIMIFEEIKSLGYLRILNRAKKVDFDWDSWCNKPCIS